jgi:hypothetical protein
MYIALIILGTLFWAATYTMIIRRGFLDNTYGIPLAALAAKISWELIFIFIHPHEMPRLAVYIVWLSFDAVIVYQYLTFGIAEMKNVTRSVFIGVSAAALVVAFFLMLLITHEFNEFYGGYTAFGLNLMMSVLFIMLLHSRQNLRGQTMYTAIAKCIGTLMLSLAYYLYEPRYSGSALMTFFYISILFFDLAYIGYVYYFFRKENISPWSRY